MLNSCFVERDLRQRLVVGTLGTVIGVLGYSMSRQQGSRTAERELRVGQVGLVLFELRLRNRQISPVLVDNALVGTRVDPRADLALLDLGVVVAVQLLDDPGNGRANDDRQLRIDCSRCRHGAGHRTFCNWRSDVMHGAAFAQAPPRHGGNCDDEERNRPADQPIFLGPGCRLYRRRCHGRRHRKRNELTRRPRLTRVWHTAFVDHDFPPNPYHNLANRARLTPARFGILVWQVT